MYPKNITLILQDLKRYCDACQGNIDANIVQVNKISL